MSGPLAPQRAKIVFGVVVALMVTSTVSLVLRFVGKRIKKTPFSAEDALIIAAQIFVYALGCVILSALGTIGHHASDLPPSKIPPMMQKTLAMQCLYPMSLGLTKISICVFYNRLFDRRAFHIASRTIIAVIIAWMICVIFSALFVCQPLSGWWDFTKMRKSCGNYVVAYIVTGVVDVSTDMAMIILPQPLLWKLKVPMMDKIALACIFGTGAFTMVISILRVESIANISFDDISYTASYSLMWTYAEPAVALSVACAPFFRPIFRKTFPKPSVVERQTAPSYTQPPRRQDRYPSFVDPNIQFEIGRVKENSDTTTQNTMTGN